MKNILDFASDPDVQAGIRNQVERNGINVSPVVKCDSRSASRRPSYRSLLIPKAKQRVPYRDLEVRIRELIQPILEWHRVSLKQLLSPARDQLTFDCRRECILVARIATDASVTQLGRFFHRDHTAICYTLKKGVLSPFAESFLSKE